MSKPNPWDAAASAERAQRVIDVAGTIVTLTAPASMAELDGAAWSQSELATWVKVYRDKGMKVDENHVQQARYVMALVTSEPKPSLDQLMALASTNAPLFKRLTMAAMDLCGLLDWGQFVKVASGNPAADAAP